jgi:hypothetical protein
MLLIAPLTNKSPKMDLGAEEPRMHSNRACISLLDQDNPQAELIIGMLSGMHAAPDFGWV